MLAKKFKRKLPRQNALIFEDPKNANEFRLYLNGAIQFSSRDEYRYHESLVHIAMMQHPNPKKILLLGGGEGLAAREVLKYDVDKIDLVDIDPAITRLSMDMDLIKELNQKVKEAARFG